MSNKKPTDLELLAMRAEGLVDHSIGIRFDRTTTMEEALGSTSIVPTHLAAALETMWNTPRQACDPTTPPPMLDECERLLVAEGWKVRIGKVNLVYVIPQGVSFASSATLHRSDDALPTWLRQANPGNWDPIEWDELLDGKLGPWVMATDDRRVVSITHTPTLQTEQSVEAGAWTDPEFRGRGYGAAVTAEWADVLRPSGRVLFYSTGPDNVSSQRLAERLGLRRVGHQWLVRNRDLEEVSDVHPASVLRRQLNATEPPTIPPIETDRLRLESMSVGFLSAMLTGNIAQAQQRIDHRIPPDFSLSNKLRSVEHRLRLIQADASQQPWMYRAIVRKEDGELLGHISFHHKAPDPDLQRHGETGAELAYTIEPAHRRRGYAKESAIGMMEWASRESGVRSFVLTISPHNLPSLKTAESMGFVVIGEQHDPVDGPELVMRAEIERILASKPR